MDAIHTVGVLEKRKNFAKKSETRLECLRKSHHVREKRFPLSRNLIPARVAIKHNLLIIPGSVFSRHDTHFRISYAVSDATLKRGIEILRQLA